MFVWEVWFHLTHKSNDYHGCSCFLALPWKSHLIEKSQNSFHLTVVPLFPLSNEQLVKQLLHIAKDDFKKS